MKMSTPESRATNMPQTVDDQGSVGGPAVGGGSAVAPPDAPPVDQTADAPLPADPPPAAAAPPQGDTAAPQAPQAPPAAPAAPPPAGPPITERGPLASRRDYTRNPSGYSGYSS